MKIMVFVLAALMLSGVAFASGKVIRATDMGSNMWSELAHGKMSDVVVEFHQGDELPVTFEAQGDLLETKQSSVSYVSVKKNFWLQLSQNKVEISCDGTSFKNLSDVLSGSLEVGAGSAQNGGVADAINIAFKAFLK